jgi:hypothetical protein
MVTLQLAPADAVFLSEQLGAQLDHLQYELVHTDDRALHKALAEDLDHLKTLRERVTRAIDARASDVSV